jgi:superfamily II DNA/RNA helicase
VASRGIHVDSVDCVIHFDPPGDDDTYLHRSGRTGRAGESGRVVSLITPDQERAARQLQGRFGYEGGFAQAQPSSATPRAPRQVHDAVSTDQSRPPRKKAHHAGGHPGQKPGSSASQGRSNQRRRPKPKSGVAKSGSGGSQRRRARVS